MYVKNRASAHRSNTTGSVLVYSLAALGVLLAIAFFALSYTRLLGVHQEQKTAIEAAAIADRSRFMQYSY